MTTKIFHEIPDVCAEEICGSEDTVSASGDELVEQDDSHPATRSRTSSQEESGEELGGPPTTRSRADSGALLDMLAEVASQKLLFSPMKRKTGIDHRKLNTEGSITLSQVKSLSTNQLIKLFSTTEFNEMKKLYSFHCAFDQNCEAKFISFGNENQAKEKFKKHLLTHLETLKANENQTVTKPSKNKKKLAVGKRRKVKEVIKEEEVPYEEENEYVEEEEEKAIIKKPKLNWDEGFIITDMLSNDNKVEVEMVTEEVNPVDLNAVAENSAALDLNKLIAGLSEKMGVTGVAGEHSYFTAEKPIKTENATNQRQEEENPEDLNEVDVVHPSEELRHFMDIETKDTVMVCVVEGNTVVFKHLPPVGQQIDVESSATDDLKSKSEYNVIRSSELPVIANNRTNSPPPPTAYLDPSALWELNHGVNIERDEFQQARKPKGKAKFIGQSKVEKERALEAIEAIRKKTGGGLDTLQCTICQPPRAFTAPTTLISHYRSHAGIKPYECRICNAVFTRQHSLNYHMLIHTNQTRFTCQDCGRKFRHPSHFKEHRRRHTGESPFECSDCLMRFKTRNTYKRHLRTRHGKVLTTSGGLIILSEDEFQMVRTVPRQNVTPVKRGRPRKLNPLSGEYDQDGALYDETTIDAIDEDIQALHQLEIVTSHESNYDQYNKDNSIDIDEMPVDFITDENDETGSSTTNAAYEEIVKEAVRLEKAEKEKKLQQQLRDSQKRKYILQSKTYDQSDEETIIIETEDPLSGSGLYLATLEDGETVLVNTNEDMDDEDEDEEDSNQEINLGFKVVEVGRSGKYDNQTLAQFSNQYLSEDELSESPNHEPTVIVIKNEPLS